ncbi:hypothetical protein ACRAWD_24535 [Caulobacter segnis]
MVMTKKGEADRLMGWMKSSAGAAIFTGPTETPAGWIAVGRAFTRLRADGDGLSA